MRKLTDAEVEKIVSLLKEGKPLPEDYKNILFDTKKEYELIYVDKEREEDILADTMAVPLQKIKIFRNGIPSFNSSLNKGGTEGGWTNMLIFGDNLQVLKTLLQMKQEGKLKNADGTPGVRLVYIDPPFATKQEFKGSQDQKAYQDKIVGARFLDFLRKRLIFLRELLSDGGSIYVHLDYRKIHYVKALLDEIFQENNFVNEIIWQRTASHNDPDRYGCVHDGLLFYRKSNERIWDAPLVAQNNEYVDTFFVYAESPGGKTIRLKKGQELPPGWRRFRLGNFASPRPSPSLIYEYKGYKPPKNGWKVNIEKMKELDKGGRLYFPPNKDGRIQTKSYLDEVIEGKVASDVWTDIPPIQAQSAEKQNYPTQKPEALLARIIEASSNPGDLIMDCFAGSGTALAVAEKLGRRWIGADCGKLAIYTMQKRLLNIAASKDLKNPKKKYGKPCKPFTLYNAGLYDYKMIKELPWEQYRDFALRLFQCRDEKHEISKIELDGYLGADSVMVFNYQKHPNAMLDRGFIDDLHKHLGDKIGRRFFIIAPAASVQFLEDYIEKGKTKYFILRIPYSIIEEIHNRGFSKIKQPVSEMDVNDTVDAVGFDFIQVPTVECKYYLDKPKNPNLLNQKTKECVIRIEKFESKVISRKPLEFANLETLSMVMLDYDFDGVVFDLDEVFYAEDLKKHALSRALSVAEAEGEGNDYKVRFAEDKVKQQIMVIYIDIFGNEKREIKTLKDFKGR